MKSAVIVFPGSNCDRDMAVALEKVTGKKPLMVWHGDYEMPDVDFIALPGGFSYGDYLRCGAMSAASHIMGEVKMRADKGVPVLGVCNGFQILTESGLLPGALMRNAGLKFICRDVTLRVDNNTSLFTRNYREGDLITVPVAHHDGNYYCDDETLARLDGDNRIAFRYADLDGNANEAANINGSRENIAGILNERGNVLGMMPHPERLIETALGGTDGRILFESAVAALAA